MNSFVLLFIPYILRRLYSAVSSKKRPALGKVSGDVKRVARPRASEVQEQKDVKLTRDRARMAARRASETP